MNCWSKKKRNWLEVNEGEIREGSELRGENAKFAIVKGMILAREDVPVANEVNDVETYLFLLHKQEDKWPSPWNHNDAWIICQNFVAIQATKKIQYHKNRRRQ